MFSYVRSEITLFLKNETIKEPVFTRESAAVVSSELRAKNAMLSADLRASHDIQSSLKKKVALLEQGLQSHEDTSR